MTKNNSPARRSWRRERVTTSRTLHTKIDELREKMNASDYADEMIGYCRQWVYLRDNSERYMKQTAMYKPGTFLGDNTPNSYKPAPLEILT